MLLLRRYKDLMSKYNANKLTGKKKSSAEYGNTKEIILESEAKVTEMFEE